jgi:hypothetical protein
MVRFICRLRLSLRGKALRPDLRGGTRIKA